MCFYTSYAGLLYVNLTELESFKGVNPKWENAYTKLGNMQDWTKGIFLSSGWYGKPQPITDDPPMDW